MKREFRGWFAEASKKEEGRRKKCGAPCGREKEREAGGPPALRQMGLPVGGAGW